MRVRLAVRLSLLLWLVAAVPRAASVPAYADADTDADKVTNVTLNFAELGGKLVIKRLALGPLLFDERTYRNLDKNPLATVIVVRLYVYPRNQTEPIAYRLMTLRIVYDLWLEEYEVRIDGLQTRTRGRQARLDVAYRALTEFTDLAIADLGDVAIGSHYYLGIVAELNPVSDETLAEVRRWLTRPAGSARPNRGTSFFGSFVSVFVNAKLPEADRVVRVRSQPFYRVPPP